MPPPSDTRSDAQPEHWNQQQQEQSHLLPSIWNIDAPRNAAEWALHFDDFANVRQFDLTPSQAALYAPGQLVLNGSPDFSVGSYTDIESLWAQEAEPSNHQAVAATTTTTTTTAVQGELQQSQPQDAPLWQHLQASSSDSSSNPSATSAGKRKEAPVAHSEDEQVELNSQSDDEGSNTSRKPSKVQRRQGVTCDACRCKHLRCDLYERRTSNGLPPNPVAGQPAQLKCTRCTNKQLDCTKNHSPPSRRYSRPSRTGKRIEQARLLHGSMPSELTTALTNPALGSANHADGRLAGHVMGATVSLRLLTCFATAHLQLPVVDFAHFSTRYNYARGDAHTMSVMSNGGSPLESIPSSPLAAPGLCFATWGSNNESTVSTSGTAQTLIAVMHAWAAHYTDLPIAFGPQALELGARQDLTPKQQPLASLSDEAVKRAKSSQEPAASSSSVKKPKRNQGVACDTCRLRRVRCDVTEREPGFGCTRCQDKGIRCSTAYINSKRSANGLPPIVPLTATSAAPAPIGATSPLAAERGVGPNAWFWKSRGAENRDWIDGGPKLAMDYQVGRAKEMLRWGKARKAFCHQLLSHAVALVHKYDLLNRPSVEGTQCLLILAQVLDRTDPTSAPLFAEAAARHLIILGLEQAHEVHEQDQPAVEDLISNMQRCRIFYSAWGYDQVNCLLTRKVPHYQAERAIIIKGGVEHGAKSSSAIANASQQKSSNLQLSGETGLSFSLLAMLQIGALARFVTLRIDQPMPTGTRGQLSPQQRFSQRYQAADISRLQQACAALWRSLDCLLLFFDRCTEAARPAMSSLTTFQPLIWIANIKIAASMVELATFRILSERFAVQGAYMTALTQAFLPATAHSSVEAAHMAALSHLLHRSRERTLLGCRSTARLSEMLLHARVFHTGGTLVAQLSAICQFLIRTPPVARQEQDGAGSGQPSPLSNFYLHVDPRSLDSRSPFSDGIALAPSTGTRPYDSSNSAASSRSSGAPQNPTVTSEEEADETLVSLNYDSKRIPVAPMPDHLPPFVPAAKAREVGAIMEALAQLGYSFDLEEVISAIDLLRISNL